MKWLIGVPLALMASTLAVASPSVFVRGESGFAWWLREMEGRILGKAAGPVTAEKLSAYLAVTMIYSPYKVCSLEAAQLDSFVGIDRATQAEIQESGQHAVWRIEATTPDGRPVVGHSVIFEGCDEEDPRGAALLVTDKNSGEVRRWQVLGQNYNGEKSYPAWVMFLHPKQGDELFSFSGCLECGDRTHVYYDVTRKSIYTEHNGH